MGFDPYNRSLKFQEFNSQNGSSLGSVRVHSFTLSYIFESMRYDSLASLLACNLANPCLGREPKARVATFTLVGCVNKALDLVLSKKSIKNGFRVNLAFESKGYGWKD
jgi:hypothetical protein